MRHRRKSVDTNSKTYNPKKEYSDPGDETARNNYKNGADFDPTDGHGVEADVDPAPTNEDKD